MKNFRSSRQHYWQNCKSGLMISGGTTEYYSRSMNFKQQIFLKADEDVCLPDEKLLNTRVIFLRKAL